MCAILKNALIIFIISALFGCQSIPAPEQQKIPQVKTRSEHLKALGRDPNESCFETVVDCLIP